MDQIEKGIIYIGSYFMLFIASVGLVIMKDLPLYFDVIIYLACIYIAWSRDEILAYHIIGAHVKCDGGMFKRLVSSIMRIVVGLIIIKLMVLGLYQYVLILYVIDYITWLQADRALSHVVGLFSIERTLNESKA